MFFLTRPHIIPGATAMRGLRLLLGLSTRPAGFKRLWKQLVSLSEYFRAHYDRKT